jgi:hypothetical protein
MTKKKPTAGERMITSAKQALAFATGEENHGCVVHIPETIDVKAIREQVDICRKVNLPPCLASASAPWSIGSTGGACRQDLCAPF